MRKWLCVPMILALLLAGCGAQGGAVETTAEPTVGAVTATLGGAEVTFEPWEQAGLPESGDYYLTADVELTERVTVAGQLRLMPVMSATSRWRCGS